MSDLSPGDVVTMKRFVWSTDMADMTFAKLEGKRKYAFLFLGAGSPEKPLDADNILNALGWAFDPERAQKQLAERLAA